MHLFGDTPGGIVLLDIILLVFGGVLIPMLWMIFDKLRQMLENSEASSKALVSLCDTLQTVTVELTEARVRDIEIKNEIENVRQALRDHIQEEREK